MKPYYLLVPLALMIQLAACSSDDDSTPLPIDDVEQPVGSPAVVQIPDYKGELVFQNTLRVNMEPLITEAGLDRAENYRLSRDGNTVLMDMVDERSMVAAYATVDTLTGEASLLATDVSENTRLLFDAQNTPTAVMATGCDVVSYTPTFNDSVTDLSNLVPEGRCISYNPVLSADGNVVLFSTYEPLASDKYDVSTNSTVHAYTLGTANLVDYPEISLDIDGVVYSALYEAVSSGGQYDFSDDGQQLFSQQRWEGINADGKTVHQVGAVLWDTVTGEWLVHGQAPDPRECIVLPEQFDCVPLYSYALSNDGNTQYFEIPTSELLEEPGFLDEFTTSVAHSQAGSSVELPLEDTGTVSSLVVNADGDQVVFFAGSDSESLSPGYTIYQSSSDTLVSLNRALRACPLTDADGNEVDESDCQYTNGVEGARLEASRYQPGYYTANGQHLLLREIFRHDAESVQIVENFMLDVEDGAMYSLPESYGDRYEWISGDASVVLGFSYPPSEILISRR